MSETQLSPEMEERLSLLEEHEELLINAAERIDQNFHELFRVSDHVPTQKRVDHSLKTVLAYFDEGNQETREELVYALLNIMLELDAEYIEAFKQRNTSPKIIQILYDLTIKYQSDINEMRNVSTEGQHFWKDVRTEPTRRNNGVAGIDYHLLMNGETTELSVSLTSNMELVRILLEGQNDAIVEFPGEADRQVSEEHLDVIDDQIENIRETLKTIEEQQKMLEEERNNGK